MIQAGLPAGDMRTFATLLDTFQFEEEIGDSLVVKEPVGVVAAITPWNYRYTRSSARSVVLRPVARSC